MKRDPHRTFPKKGHSKSPRPVRVSANDYTPGSDAPTYIVGIGASAGGLEALEKLLKAMPVNTGMAFVIIQHLSPDFKSLMNELLARHTTMPIVRVDEPVEIKRNTVYLIPPRKEMVIAGSRLHTHDRPIDQAISMPINVFFRSLAREAKDRAIAIVLSGTGTDGSAGLLDIHDMNGLILVQSEQSAKFDGMPHSAIETGLADAVLDPEEMPGTLKAYAENPAAPLLQSKSSISVSESLVGLPAVIEKLREVYDIDFAYYKPATISRRIDRRISMVNCMSFQEYSNRVVKDPVELDALYRDLLIGVTRFFRDPEAFEIIREQIIKPIVESAKSSDEVRIWVPGCATGEEAYTYAILFQEAADAMGRRPNVKIFATDVHRESLQLASDGIYSETSMAEVSAERKARFFKHEGGRYRINSRLRKMLVFSPHNLIKDPPFTKMDIVSCRNLMIYFQPPAQAKALATMHFALKLRGGLILGPSEGTSELTDEFEVLDRQWKIFRKVKDSRLPLDMRMSLAPAISPLGGRASSPGDIRLARAYEGLLARFVPTGALINEKRDLLHVFGDADRYLRPPAGRMTTDIVGMARGDLRIALSSAIQNCVKRNERVSFKGVRIRGDQEHTELLLNLIVEPIHDKVTSSNYMFVLFQDPHEVSALEATTPEQFEVGEESQARIRQLEQELQHTKESLQTTVEELETSNEELQASNEELLAANEELQSTNEELHSVNEELYSVNAEHEQKIRDLIETTNDLDNLMRSTEIGSIFLDSSHCIRLFTPAATEIFNVLPQDEGRDIKHITYRVKGDDIIEVINEVWKTHKLDEKQVTAQNGRAYLRRVMPYWDESRQIAGIVLTFVDVSELMAAERQLRLSEFSVNHAAVPTFWIDDRGHILRVNRASCEMLGYSEDQLLGLCVPEINTQFTEASWQEHWESLRSAKRTTFQSMLKHADGRMIDVEFESNWFEFEGSEYNFAFVRDITERRKAEERIRNSEQLFRSTFELATVGLSHMSMEGKILKVNKQLSQFLGYSPDALIGRSILDFVTPEDMAKEENQLQNLRLHHTREYDYERRFVRSDGRIAWGYVHGTLVDETPDSPQYMLRVIVDITERKHAEEALRQSEERFRLLVEGGPQAMVMVDTTGTITVVNSQTEEIFGRRRGELLGRNVDMLLPSRLRDEFAAMLEDFTKSPTPRPLKMTNHLFGLRRDESEVPIEMGFSPLRVGERTFVLISIADTTERTRAEQAIRESLDEKETLLKEVHHRVKNNLQLICSMLRLQSEYVDNPQAQTVFSESEGRVRSMALIHEKLYQTTSLAHVDFADYANSLTNILMQTYSRAAQRVRSEVSIEHVQLGVDVAIPLGLILNELVANSLKHAFQDGREGLIRIRLSRLDNHMLELLV